VQKVYFAKKSLAGPVEESIANIERCIIDHTRHLFGKQAQDRHKRCTLQTMVSTGRNPFVYFWTITKSGRRTRGVLKDNGLAWSRSRGEQ